MTDCLQNDCTRPVVTLPVEDVKSVIAAVMTDTLQCTYEILNIVFRMMKNCTGATDAANGDLSTTRDQVTEAIYRSKVIDMRPNHMNALTMMDSKWEKKRKEKLQKIELEQLRLHCVWI